MALFSVLHLLHLFPLMLFLLPKICALPHNLTFSGTDYSKDHSADRIIILSLIFALLFYLIVFPVLAVIISHHGFPFRLNARVALPKIQGQPLSQLPAALFRRGHGHTQPYVREEAAPEPLAIPTEHLPFPVLPPGTHDQQHPLHSTSHRPSMLDSIEIGSEHSFAASETSTCWSDTSAGSETGTVVRQVIPTRRMFN